MPRYSSVFGFSGPIDRLSIRVQLFQKGAQTLDFDRFHQENQIDEKPQKSRLDDVTFGWKQRISQSNRRIFTLSDEDPFPEYLEAFRPPPNEKEPENVKGYEYPVNEFVVLRSTAATRPVVKKSYLLIFARLGSMDVDDPSAVELIARLTATSSNRLIVEPCLDEAQNEGIPLETKFGDYLAKIKIEDRDKDKDSGIDEQIGGRSRKSRVSISSLPEAEHFLAARDGLVESVVNVEIAKAWSLLFEEGLTIDYKIRLPRGVRLKSKNATGRSQRFAADENGNAHFGYCLEFVFETAQTEEVSPILMLKIMAVDYWGRQYIAGYGSAFISFTPGRSKSKIALWRPISHNALYEMFVGQAVDVDYFSLKNPMERAGIDSQPSGIVRIECTCVSQSRHYMARDILYQLKYGSKMADMGLRSDFYQRIIKVLMEFEEARSKLILARAINKKKIKM
ncbi:unnamed protein product [Caenorhabditis sp. 36 PRJEB53466]|nr:unnamed protein product [Caenorhabditis sp. 36 PRJEB53466]